MWYSSVKNCAPPFTLAVMMGLIVAALHQAQQGWTTQRGGGATAQLQPAWSGCAVVTFDFTRQPFAARTLVALVCLHLMLQLAGWSQVVGLVNATIEHIDTPLRGPFLDISSCS